jgi:hypothetical protein
LHKINLFLLYSCNKGCISWLEDIWRQFPCNYSHNKMTNIMHSYMELFHFFHFYFLCFGLMLTSIWKLSWFSYCFCIACLFIITSSINISHPLSFLACFHFDMFVWFSICTINSTKRVEKIIKEFYELLKYHQNTNVQAFIKANIHISLLSQ